MADWILSNSQNLNDKQKYSFKMLKGKALDMKGDYQKATEVFENNLKEYVQYAQKNAASENDETRKEISNLEFRYGWSLIRSKKNVDQGL